MSERPIAELASSLLPTPNAQESTPTDEYVEEMNAAGIQPGERLYLPGRKWHAQRSLSRVAPSLLPTPAARDLKGGTMPDEAEQLHRSRGEGGRSDLASAAMWVGRDHPLLVTPLATEGSGGSQPQEKRRAGGHGPTLADQLEYLPTPAAWDGDRGPDYARADREGSGGDDLVTTMARLMPTPTGNPGPTPGNGVTLADAVTLLPTPTLSDGKGGRNSTCVRANAETSTAQPGDTLTDIAQKWSGVSTDQRSPGGSTSPDDSPRLPLTDEAD
jgi:hypothetical protein